MRHGRILSALLLMVGAGASALSLYADETPTKNTGRSDAAAAAPKLEPMPEVVKFGAGSWDRFSPEITSIPSFSPSQYLLGVCRDVLSEDPKKQVAFCGLANEHRHNYKMFHNDVPYVNWLGELHVGDIVPISRAVYRVESMRSGRFDSRGYSRAMVTFRRLDEPLMGVKVTKGSSFRFTAHDGLDSTKHRILRAARHELHPDVSAPGRRQTAGRVRRRASGVREARYHHAHSDCAANRQGWRGREARQVPALRSEHRAAGPEATSGGLVRTED